MSAYPVLLLLVCGHASYGAETAPIVDCDAWAVNAHFGAHAAQAGRPRKLVPLTQPDLMLLIRHNHLDDVDGIPVLEEDYAESDGRAFLEESVFYGFDHAESAGAPQGATDSEAGSIARLREVCAGMHTRSR